MRAIMMHLPAELLEPILTGAAWLTDMPRGARLARFWNDRDIHEYTLAEQPYLVMRFEHPSFPEVVHKIPLCAPRVAVRVDLHFKRTGGMKTAVSVDLSLKLYWCPMCARVYAVERNQPPAQCANEHEPITPLTLENQISDGRIHFEIASGLAPGGRPQLVKKGTR